MSNGVSGVWPLNELGEIVALAGVGSNNVAGYLSESFIPADNATGKLVIKFPASIGGGGSSDIAFSTSVPLTSGSTSYMPQQTVSSVLSFTPAASAVKNSLVYLRLIADGTNTPTFTGFKEWGGSLGYSNVSGTVNQIQFFYDGYDSFFSASQAVTAAVITVPGAPTIGTATATTSTAGTVSFSAPVSSGGSAITGYTVTSSPAGGVDSNAGSTSLTHTVTGLTTGTAYTFTVKATNSAGTGAASAASNSITPVAAVAPGAPSLVATAGAGAASVAITQGTGGTPTGYTVTSSPAGGVDSAAGTTTTPRSITGLTNGTSYTFTATATNATGTSASSAASNSVTPAASSAVAGRLTSLLRMTESGTAAPYSYTGTSNGFAGALNQRHITKHNP